MPLDFDAKQEVERLIAEKLDLLSAFKGMDVKDLEQIGQDLEHFLYGRQSALRKPENTYTPRWTKAGADINLSSTGVGKGHAGPTLPRTIDLLSGTAYLDANDPSILHISGGGGAGADCMFDALTSTCFLTLSGFTEGQIFTTVSGCTFKGYSTIQGAITAMVALVASKVIFVCHGAYSENLTLSLSSTTSHIQIVGAGVDQVVVTAASSATPTFQKTGSNPLTMRDMTLVGNGANDVINGGLTSREWYANLVLKPQASGTGFVMPAYAYIDRMVIDGTSAASGIKSRGGSLEKIFDDVTITGCTTGIDYQGNPAAQLDQWNNVTVYGATSGMYAQQSCGKLTNFTNMRFESCTTGIGGSCGGYDYSTFTNIMFVNCNTSIDLSSFNLVATCSGMTGAIFNGVKFWTGTPAFIGVKATGSFAAIRYSQFTNMNFTGYTSGNEISGSGAFGTGTQGYHNLSDAGTLADFGVVTGHSSGTTGVTSIIAGNGITVSGTTAVTVSQSARMKAGYFSFGWAPTGITSP